MVGNDISGFGDPEYLSVAAAAGATVVATHIRLGPRIPDPEPVYDDVVEAVCTFLVDRARRATGLGIPADRIVLDAGLDLGKTAEQSLTLLRASGTLAGLGYPLLLSASNKTFLGKVLDLEIDQRGRPRWPPPPWVSRSVVASSGSTTWPAPVMCATRWPPSSGSGPTAGRSAGRRSTVAATVTDVRPAYLVKGDDPSLVAQAAHGLTETLVGGSDPSLAVEEFGGPGADDLDVGLVVDACTTPPFLVERRVVVVRDAGRLNAAEGAAR